MSAKGGGRNLAAAPSLIVLMSFPVGYSLASCSPAELASASPTGLIVINGPVDSNNSFRWAEAVS